MPDVDYALVAAQMLAKFSRGQFMATGGGPCRLGQYCVALDQLIEQQRIENAAVLTLTDMRIRPTVMGVQL